MFLERSCNDTVLSEESWSLHTDNMYIVDKKKKQKTKLNQEEGGLIWSERNTALLSRYELIFYTIIISPHLTAARLFFLFAFCRWIEERNVNNMCCVLVRREVM